MARSAPWLQQLRPLLSLDAPRVPQGRAAFPFSAVVPGAEERGRDSRLPVASRDQAVSVCRPGEESAGPGLPDVALPIKITGLSGPFLHAS